MNKIILWWGRSDLEYSRNRLILKLFKELNYTVIFFRPLISSLGYYEALIRLKKTPSIIWVPSFRHRDFMSAFKWSKKNNIPIIFDPLISKWDKLINEKNKFTKNSIKAKKIKFEESYFFSKANIIIADTEAHKDFYNKNFNIPLNKIYVVNVGADENLFKPFPYKENKIKEVLFYGSFLELHGIETILESFNLLKNEKIKFTLLGKYKKIINDHINLEPPIPLDDLPKRINRADIVLGIFSSSEKAGNVIPNKVFQSLACGKPIITRFSKAYPKKVLDTKHGIMFIKPNNPKELADAIKKILSNENLSIKMRDQSRKLFDTFFSEKVIKKQIQQAIINSINDF